MDFHGPRLRTGSALNSELKASARAFRDCSTRAELSWRRPDTTPRAASSVGAHQVDPGQEGSGERPFKVMEELCDVSVRLV